MKASSAAFQFTREAFADMGLDVSILDVKILEVCGQDSQEFLQGLRLGIKINKHKTAPGAYLKFPEPVALAVHVGKVPVLWHFNQLTFQ